MRCVSVRQQRASRCRPRRMRCVSARQQRAIRCRPRRMQCVSARQQRASRCRPRRMRCVSTRQQRASRRNTRRTQRVSTRQQRASRRNTRRTQRVSTRQQRAIRRKPRRTPRAARVARGAKPSCSRTSVPRRSVALRHRRNVRADSRRLTLTPISLRIPRATERAGLHVREHEGFAPRATRPFGPASWEGRKAQRVSGRESHGAALDAPRVSSAQVAANHAGRSA
jgi:hypothetical protein